MDHDGTESGRRRRRRRESLSVAEAYALLGLDPHAEREHVQATYRELVLRCHPDKGGDAERFKELVTAYKILQNRFQIEDGDPDQARGECDRCGTYDLLHVSPDGTQCCTTCLALTARRLLLPAPPVVIVSCAITIVLQCLAGACLLAGYVSNATPYGLASFVLGIASLLSLAITCATVVYTAEPRRDQRMRKRS